MAKLQGVPSFNSKGERSIKGFKIPLSKSDIEIAGFAMGDTLKIEAKDGIITITKEN